MRSRRSRRSSRRTRRTSRSSPGSERPTTETRAAALSRPVSMGERGPRRFRHTARVADEYDLIVVGAGPGGSSAAAAALRAGLSVAQLDAARFPRVKPCAGGLTPKAVRALAVPLDPSLVGAFAEFEFNAWQGARTRYSFRAPV